MTHRVYRLYGREGQLLYVGVTSNTMAARLAAHRRDKAWFEQVARHEVDRSMPEDEAFLEEQRQIVRLRPLHNSYPGKVRTVQPAPTGFGATLHAHRIAAALSPAELAEATGVSLQSIRRWESGEVLPNSIYAIQLGDALGVGFDLLNAILVHLRLEQVAA